MQVPEIGNGRKWEKQTLIRSPVNSGYCYITQFENNPGNFVSFFVASKFLGRFNLHCTNIEQISLLLAVIFFQCRTPLQSRERKLGPNKRRGISLQGLSTANSRLLAFDRLE